MLWVHIWLTRNANSAPRPRITIGHQSTMKHSSSKYLCPPRQLKKWIKLWAILFTSCNIVIFFNLVSFFLLLSLIIIYFIYLLQIRNQCAICKLQTQSVNKIWMHPGTVMSPIVLCSTLSKDIFGRVMFGQQVSVLSYQIANVN